mmetsp:Transcript_21100/g.47608  ORF Transcript_21100/g.47608 Transcript_21100/m.47608 type:complete len:565 (-) Transcript_21100:159-1853(-)
MDVSSSSVDSSMNDSSGGAADDGLDAGNQLLQQRLEKGKEALAKLLQRESLTEAARRGSSASSSSARGRMPPPLQNARRSPPLAGALQLASSARGEGGRAMEMDIGGEEDRFGRKESSGGSAHRMLEVQQFNESLLKEVAQVDEMNQDLFKENREQAMLVEQLREELRRRSEESEDDRDGILRRLTAANRLREEAVGNFEKAVNRIADMHEMHEDDMQRSEDRVQDALQRVADTQADVEDVSEERDHALRRADEAEREVDHAERINHDLRTELRALREEAAAAQERMEDSLKQRSSSEKTSVAADTALEGERAARLSLQLYLESVAATVVRDARSAVEQAKGFAEDLAGALERAHTDLQAALAANEKHKTDSRAALSAVEEQLKAVQEKSGVVSSELDASRRGAAEAKTRTDQASALLKSRIGVLEAACEMAERRQAALTGRVRARDEALSEALSRIQRLSAVEAEQGKVDWEMEVKQLRAQIKVLDALPDLTTNASEGDSSRTSSGGPIIVKAEGGGSLIATCAGEMGRKRRRYSQPESPTATAPPDTKKTSGSWFGKLLFGS